MYYIKLVFINIFRSLRYTIPLFLIFTLTTGIVVLTDNAKKTGNMLKNQISLSYIITVEAVYSPPLLLSGKSNSADMQIITMDDVEAPISFSQVKTNSILLDYLNSPNLWEINFDKARLNDEDIIVDDQSMLGHLEICGVQNSQFNDSLKLIKGSHISDEKNGEYDVLISSKLAELYNFDIGDTISFPLDQALKNNDLMAQKYKIIGITDNDNNYTMFIPYSTIIEKFNKNDFILNNIKFILKSPNLAADFIKEAIPYFDDKNYVLQADDYEYKREVYPIEMMINLNSTLHIACMITSTLLLSVIMIKSAYTRIKDITVMRFLACRKIYIFLVFYLEKFIVMLAGIGTGLIASVLLSDTYNNINAIYENIKFGININVIFFIIIIVLVCTLLLSIIFISAVRKKTMEAITHE